tara:strand:+ start:1401 stop:1652 length:252 start_codon:yes stop_codon:yes gene_type:complete
VGDRYIFGSVVRQSTARVVRQSTARVVVEFIARPAQTSGRISTITTCIVTTEHGMPLMSGSRRANRPKRMESTIRPRAGSAKS